jgi:hypothetical protein
MKKLLKPHCSNKCKEKSSRDNFGVLFDKPGKIEHYEKCFGIIAIKKGFISADYLVKGLTVQVTEDNRNMPHRLLGEILFDMGFLTNKQVDEVLSEIFHA